MVWTRVGSLALVVLAATACGEDITGIVEGDPLSEAETAALAEVVAGSLFNTWEGTSNPAPGPARVSGSVQISDSFPCEFGGSVAVNGNVSFNIDDQTGDGTVSFTVTQDHMACDVESDSLVRFVLHGSPNITSSFTVVSTGNTIDFTGGFQGAIDWSTTDKSGRCGMDVQFSLTGDVVAGTGDASLSGQVCGVSFTHTLVLTP